MSCRPKRSCVRAFRIFWSPRPAQWLPEMKEYERTSTTVVNAYLLSAMRSYLQRLGIWACGRSASPRRSW